MVARRYADALLRVAEAAAANDLELGVDRLAVSVLLLEMGASDDFAIAALWLDSGATGSFDVRDLCGDGPARFVDEYWEAASEHPALPLVPSAESLPSQAPVGASDEEKRERFDERRTHIRQLGERLEDQLRQVPDFVLVHQLAATTVQLRSLCREVETTPEAVWERYDVPPLDVATLYRPLARVLDRRLGRIVTGPLHDVLRALGTHGSKAERRRESVERRRQREIERDQRNLERAAQRERRAQNRRASGGSPPARSWKDDFDNVVMVFGAEGGAVYSAESTEGFHAIVNEMSIEEFFGKQDRAPASNVRAPRGTVFASAEERDEYLIERGWLQRPWQEGV